MSKFDWIKRDAFWYFVEPAFATEILEHRNKTNRVLRESVVKKYMREIHQGRWMETGATIAFDLHGDLVDGQHRLTAIARTGIGQWMVLVTGLHPDARRGTDQHSARTFKDLARSEGMEILLGAGTGVTENSASAMWARMVHGLQQIKGSETKQELLLFAQEHQEAGLFAMRLFGSHSRVASIHVGPVMAAVARAYYYCTETDLAKLRHFVDVLCTGLQDSRDDQPIVKFREALLKMSGRNSNFQWELYGKTARAIEAHIDGEVLSVVRTPAEDPFPLPDDGPATNPGRTDRMALDLGLPRARGSRTGHVVDRATSALLA